jgi:hypothetical protein
MRIHFERTGGFAGMRVQATVEIDSLSREQAEKLMQLVEAADFFELPEDLSGPESSVDQFHYRVTVEREDRQHTVVTGDRSAPQDLQPLLLELTRLARTRR